MAFPQATATAGNSGANANTHPITLGSPSSGDLLIVGFYNDKIETVSIPDFTELGTVEFNTNAERYTILAKIAAGSEGASVDATTTGIAEGSAHFLIKVTAASWYGTLADGVAIGTFATGSGTTPNPPNLDPANWATEDTLWFATYVWAADIAHSAYPTGYDLDQATSRWASSAGGGAACASKEAAAGSDNPGTGTLATSAQWAANTIAIRPAAAPAGGVAKKAQVITAQRAA